MSARTPPARQRLLPLFADLVCIGGFAVAGKDSHEASASGWVVLLIAWPYAASAVLAHGWWGIRDGRTWRVWREGTSVLAVTYAVGMLLRVLSGRGIAPAFLLVALLFLALTMLGWRAVVALARPRGIQPARGREPRGGDFSQQPDAQDRP